MHHSSIITGAVASNSFAFPIPNHNGYLADVDGNIYSNKSGALQRLSPKLCQNGYLGVTLRDKGKVAYRYVHQLILETFRSQRPDPLAVAAHYPDPDKTNCSIGNLIWTDRKTNAAHWLATNPVIFGGRKLNPDRVRDIRDLSAEGWTNADLARKHGVGLDIIRKILTGEHWAWVV